MEVVNAELQLQPGEADVTKGLLALNIAQESFEGLLAVRPQCLGSGVGTVTTALNTESTAYPAGLLRIDRLQYIEPSTGRPSWDITPARRAGGHATNRFWPLNLTSVASSGKPRSYWTNGANIYWSPLPDGTSTVRWYGLSAAADITASGTFVYPDIVAFPLAVLAVKYLKTGVDDAITDIGPLALEVLKPALDALARFNRDGALGLEYTQIHGE